MYRSFSDVTNPQLEREVRRVKSVISIHEGYLARLEEEQRQRRMKVDIDEKIREVLG